jgi:hypothetical protein
MAKSIKPRSNEYYRANAHRIVLYLRDVAGGVYTLLAREAKGTGAAREIAIVALLLSGYPELLGYICASLDMSRGERAANPPDRYKVVITRNREFVVGYPYPTKAASLKSFRGLASQLNLGETIFLFHDGVEIERYTIPKKTEKKRRSPRKPNHHRTGILSEDYPMDPYRRDLAAAYDPYDAYWRSPNPLDRYKVVITRGRNEFVVGYPYSTKATARESFSRLAAGLNPGEMIFLYLDGVEIERYERPEKPRLRR